MAQILDKQGLQHYANKMCNADNRKVGSKSLPATLNEIDTAIDGFKTLFETEYGTPVNMELENNENVFSIGTGTNIDKKDDVENSFTDLTLNGNSLVNCIKEGAFSSSSNFTVFENNPIIKEEKITLTSRGNSNQTRISLKADQGIIKPNTKYTFIFDVFENTLSGKMYLTYTNNSSINISYFSYQNFIEGKATGQFKYVLTSATNIENVNCLFRTMIWNDSVAGETITFSVRILEGDWINKPIPGYFEGLKSVGEKEDGNHKIEILSQNKNLFNYKEYYKYWPSTKTDDKTILSHSGDLRPGNHDIFFLSPMKVTLKPNTTYTFCLFNLKDSKQVLNCEGCLSTAKSELRLKVEIGQIGYKVFTTNSINYKDGVSFKINTSAGEKARYKIMIIEGNIMPSDYIHYDSDKKEILLNEPLRGLPNGTRDTIEKVNGEWKIVRRCEKIILNGSENWGTSGMTPQENTLIFQGDVISQLVKPNSSAKSDKFATYNGATTDEEGLLPFSGTGGTRIYFRIKKSKLSSQDVAGFKEWLSQNPTKVVYELATPIIEDISPVTLQCWKNGTISIDEILPVESIHTVALNKSAQIQKNIEELTVLRNRVKALEKQYDNSTLNQTYELELLRLDMELDNIV